MSTMSTYTHRAWQRDTRDGKLRAIIETIRSDGRAWSYVQRGVRHPMPRTLLRALVDGGEVEHVGDGRYRVTEIGMKRLA